MILRSRDLQPTQTKATSITKSIPTNQQGDSGVFLHDVVFLIDRHSCVAWPVQQGKFFEESFRTKLPRPEKLQALTRLQETNALRGIFTADLSKVS